MKCRYSLPLNRKDPRSRNGLTVGISNSKFPPKILKLRCGRFNRLKLPQDFSLIIACQIYTVAQTRRFGIVIKSMTEMRIGVSTPDFSSGHEPIAVPLLHDTSGFKRLGKTRPACSRVICIKDAEPGSP